MSKGTVIGFALLLVLASSCGAQTFSDVPQNHWAHDAVEKAARLGLVVGRGDGTYRGDAPPSRYELAMGMSKVLAEIENRMKAQPVFTRQVLEHLRALNAQLAGAIDELRHRQRYLLYLMEHTYTAELRKSMPDLRGKFASDVQERMNAQFPNTNSD